MTKITKPKIIKNTGLSDTMVNVLTKLGTQSSSTANSKFYTRPLFTFPELTNIYLGSDFAKRIIDIYAKTMTREWISIIKDPDNKAMIYLNRLKAEKHFTSQLKWSRLYGGALMLVYADDGLTLDQPLNINNIKTIESLKIFDPNQVTVQTDDYYNNKFKSNYGDIEYYTINPINNVQVLPTIKVHETRIIRINGEELPAEQKRANNDWDASAIQGIYDSLINFTQGQGYSAELMRDFVLGVLKIDNLTELMSIDGGTTTVMSRLDMMAQFRSVINMVLLGDSENYTKEASNVSGIPDLIDRFAEALSAVSGIPISILFDKWDGGLGDTGGSQVRAWYDHIAAEQKDTLQEPINELLVLIQAAKDSGLSSAEKLEFEFNPLWQRDTSQIVTDQNTQAQTDQIYIQNGVLNKEEVRQSRFATGKFEAETKLDSQYDDITFSQLSESNNDV